MQEDRECVLFLKEERGRRRNGFPCKVNPVVALEAPLPPLERVFLPRCHMGPNGIICLSGSHIRKGRWGKAVKMEGHMFHPLPSTSSIQSWIDFLLCLAIGLLMASGTLSLLNQTINLMVNYFTILSSLNCLLLPFRHKDLCFVVVLVLLLWPALIRHFISYLTYPAIPSNCQGFLDLLWNHKTNEHPSSFELNIWRL